MDDDLTEPEIRFRSATVDDRSFILDVEERTMRGYAEALWGEWLRSADPADLGVSDHFIIDCADRVVGCVHLVETQDEVTLKKLYLMPNAQNQGIGARVLAWVTGQADAADKKTALSVLSTNPARKFYAREGFRVVSRTAQRLRMERSAGGHPGATDGAGFD